MVAVVCLTTTILKLPFPGVQFKSNVLSVILVMVTLVACMVGCASSTFPLTLTFTEAEPPVQVIVPLTVPKLAGKEIRA